MGKKHIASFFGYEVDSLKIYAYDREYERYIPTKKEKTPTHPRFLKKDEGERREKGNQSKKEKGETEIGAIGEKNTNFKSQKEMLPKQNRLRKKNDFRAVFARGKGFRQGFVFLKLSPSLGGEIPRVGVVVAKRVAKQATRRNRVRRLISEVIWQELPRLRPADVVLLALPGAERASLHDIQETLRTLFRKASLYKKN